MGEEEDKEEGEGGEGDTNTDTEISYINKQKRWPGSLLNADVALTQQSGISFQGSWRLKKIEYAGDSESICCLPVCVGSIYLYGVAVVSVRFSGVWDCGESTW